MLVTRQLMITNDFRNLIFFTMKSMVTKNCLVTNILQNTSFCVQQKKKSK